MMNFNFFTEIWMEACTWLFIKLGYRLKYISLDSLEIELKIEILYLDTIPIPSYTIP